MTATKEPVATGEPVESGSASNGSNGETGSGRAPARKKRRLFRNFSNRLGTGATVIGALVALVPFVVPPGDAHEQAAAPTPTVAAPTADQSTVVPGPEVVAPVPAPVTRAGGKARDTTGGTSAPVTAEPPMAAPTTIPGNVPPISTTPPGGSGIEPVRFSGTLVFGSFDLDSAEPRYVEGMNVWRISPIRLYGDAYDMAHWVDDSTPGRGECAAFLTAHAGRDADGLAVGSRVCGRTPLGRIFRIEILEMGDQVITGRVVVWA